MTKQYQTEGVIDAPKPVVKTERISDQKIVAMADQIAELQQQTSRNRTEIARLKNRISELERNISPRG